jgi:hypothetical protein
MPLSRPSEYSDFTDAPILEQVDRALNSTRF